MTRLNLLILIAVLYNISQTNGHFLHISQTNGHFLQAGQDQRLVICEGQTKQFGCKNGGLIKIVNAVYGRLNKGTCLRRITTYFAKTNCRSAVSMEVVQRICQDKSHCILSARNADFGDPCVGVYKYLEVTYKCVAPVPETCGKFPKCHPSAVCVGNDHCECQSPKQGDGIKGCYQAGQDQRLVICEGQTKLLGCKDGGLIKIVNAVYGRLNKGTCLRRITTYFAKTNCRSAVSMEVVQRICQDKSHCILSARNADFGDPCVGVYKYLEVTYKCVAPVPETCGKFPKCHPSAVCVGNDHCECQSPKQGDGIKGCYPVCWCQAAGDPHYRMFDGQRVDFMGTCKYTMSRYVKAGDQCSYAVEVKNEQRGGNTRVSYTRLVDVRVYGTTIRLHLHKRVYVNGKGVYLPYKTDQFEIAFSGRYVRLETRCGLVVQFDGAHDANIRVPNVYGNDLTGICGNCNNNPNDDKKDYTQYEVVDDSDLKLQHCKKVEDFHPCAQNPTFKSEGESTSVCRVMNPASTTSTAFSQCITGSKADAQLFFSSCVYDYCAYRIDNKDGKALEKVLCDDVSALATLCGFRGITVKWRTSTLCPLPCGPNSHYSAEVSACPATCVDRAAPSKCTRNSVEGCECDTGYVLSNQRCVRVAECGCSDKDGEYYPLGTEFVSGDCSVVRQCKAVGNEMEIVVKETRKPCGTNAGCKIKDGQYTCVCKARHTGDPLKACIAITCGANAHYVTKVSACPASCQDPSAPDSCTKPMVEGCACDKGFVRNGGQCTRVQNCGCRDDGGNNYRDGAEFVSSDCSVVRQCKAVGNEMKIVVKETRKPCGTNAECKVQDGQYTCVCKARHTGDPLKGCTVPETCGKFPKCHPSAVCVGNDHCECQAPKQGDGIKGCYPVCWCQAAGDPHYRMFDGQRVDFMGTCKYTMSRYVKAGDQCSYAVEVKNEQRRGNTRVSYTRLVDVRVYGTTIRLHLHKRVYVNGKGVYLPYKTDQFEIAFSGRYVRLETRCGLVVQFDGAHDANIRVPNVYGNDLTGICGNCNNNPNDDQRDYTQYEVVDDSDLKLQHCKKVEDFHPCAQNPTFKSEGESTSVCRVMNPASTTSTAFSQCITGSKADAQLFFSSCVYDYCAYRIDNKDGKALEKVLCDDVSALATLCGFRGITVKWRTSTLCPLPCGPNSHYSAEVSACPATCVDRAAPSKCTRNSVEGCECDTGYVLSNQRCVRVAECGCSDKDGEYYPLGTEFVSGDCSVVRQCKAVGNEMKIVVKETRKPCGTNAGCKIKDGQYTCVCKARHTGDPLKACIAITCGANAHYVTKVSACPASCQDPSAPDSCTKPMVEGCACDKGFVRNGGQCTRVQNCGCRDDGGNNYRDGAEFVSSDCSVVRQCKAVGDEMKIVVKETRKPCGTNAECKVQDGQYTCVCKARHTGDPLKGCTVPETCGKFPKCHPSAVCVGNDHCECQAPKQGDGIKGCYPVCWCQAAGDPHYRMFDGQRVDFMGTCKYTMSRYVKAGDQCSYAVEVKNEQRGGNTRVSYTRLVDVRVYGTTIRLHLHKRVFVNGKGVYLPYKTDQFEIAFSGRYVRLETRCGLVVQFDGAHDANIRVPNVYGNDLTGICGNCNNNPNDDKKDYTQYEVVDDSDLKLQHCKKVEDFHPCAQNPTFKSEGETTSVCRVMNPASTTYTAFSQCITGSKADAQLFFSSCVYDYCAYRIDNKDGKALEKVLCDDVSALATLCGFRGITVKWRTSTLCPLPCGPNSHYSAEVSACPATCVDRAAPSKCTRNSVEGCECDTGYVLSNQRCVRVAECGCSDKDGEYYPLGTEFVSGDCSVVRQCKAVGNEMKIVVKETRKPCGTNAGCKIKDGQYTCVCKARHTGDPLKACIAITCGANAHYVTKVSACPASCQDPSAPDSCTKPMVEGCACDKGFVRNGGQCTRVQNCGCRDDNGSTYRDGAEFVSSDCSVVRQCKAVGDEMKIVVKETRKPCGTNAECNVMYGQYTCVCKARYTGDPLKGCTAPRECRTEVDGSRYQGAMSETVTGKNCTTWNTLKADRYAILGGHNSCRNPKSEKKAPWCFVNAGKAWEYCDISMCNGKKPGCIATTKISCSSPNGQSRRCKKVGVRTITWVDPKNDPKCVFGFTYGRENGEMWVNGGCGGIFNICYKPDKLSYQPKPTPTTECKKTRKGTDYKGTWGITTSGRLCQSWSSQYPQANKFYKKLAGESNYCRNPNPDVRKRPWCFVDDPKSKTRWEYCNILYC